MRRRPRFQLTSFHDATCGQTACNIHRLSLELCLVIHVHAIGKKAQAGASLPFELCSERRRVFANAETTSHSLPTDVSRPWGSWVDEVQ